MRTEKRIRILIIYASVIEADFDLEGLYENCEVYVKICGIGPAYSILESYLAISELNPDLVINAGIAGAFLKNGPRINEVVYIKSDTIENSKHTGDGITNISIDQDFNEAYVFNSSYEKIHGLRSFKGLTVSLMSGSRELSDKRYEQFKADTESMEGGSVMLAAKKLDVPVIQIRSISNLTGTRQINKDYLVSSINSLNETLYKLISVIDYDSLKTGNITLPK
ncbi:MAG: hypothetical protein JXR48_14275 [Candidatus Delongbacteria bacterium]|nr:hypothetical protein [Candidatus Delongbacteria bacterium]MBN2836121.1 hypothetical protein [Candidatus Delongbacteria bacterium]